MKWFITGLILIFAAPTISLFGQSTLIFTRVMEPGDFPTSGFAVGNPLSAPAQVTLTLYSRAGQSLGSATLTVPANGTVAKIASELFPTAVTGGWIEGTSSASGLVAFWLAGDWVQFGDGAGTASASRDLALALVTPNAELDVVNPSADGLTIQIRLYGNDGSEVAAPAIRIVSAKGAFRENFSSLFAAGSLEFATHARLICVNPFAASIIARNYLANPSWSVLNAVPSNSTQTDLYFPHVISGAFGGANYTNSIGMINLADIDQDIRLTFTPADGSEPISVTRSLEANGGLRESAQAIFGFGSGYRDGWVRVSGTLPLTGFVAYADVVPAGTTIVAPQSVLRTEIFFAHFADLPPWMTGIALLNIDTSDANIEVAVFTQTGIPIGNPFRFSLPAFAKVARLLREMVPQTQARLVAEDGGVVRVRSNIPIFGMELFFTTDLKILSGIGSPQ